MFLAIAFTSIFIMTGGTGEMTMDEIRQFDVPCEVKVSEQHQGLPIYRCAGRLDETNTCLKVTDAFVLCRGDNLEEIEKLDKAPKWSA